MLQSCQFIFFCWKWSIYVREDAIWVIHSPTHRVVQKLCAREEGGVWEGVQPQSICLRCMAWPSRNWLTTPWRSRSPPSLAEFFCLAILTLGKVVVNTVSDRFCKREKTFSFNNLASNFADLLSWLGIEWSWVLMAGDQSHLFLAFMSTAESDMNFHS